MSEDLGLGKIIEPGREVHRDAIHVAVIPMTATVLLLSGNRVNAQGLPIAPHVGIVDPFLPDVVQPGQRYWLWLFPGTVTGMRHHWQHPAFAEQTTPAAVPVPAKGVAESEAWLRQYAVDHNPYINDPNKAFAHLIDGLKHDEVFYRGTDLYGLDELDDADELRHHAEQYLGIRIDWSNFSFSCSC